MKVEADSPWKDVCESKLALLFAALWPDVFASLDWGKDHEALDGELRKRTADVLTGQRIADRLIKAFDRACGDARYFHLEVQGKKEAGFRRRVHVCNARCEERFGCHVTSLVVLTDTNPRWRPSRYVSGCFPAGGRRFRDERTLRFLTVKLIDFEGREAELEAGENPVGLFLVAHLTALRARKDIERRAAVKLRLLLNLRQRKMTADDVQFWERCFDWLLQLPEAHDRAIWDELQRLDTGGQGMPFVSYAERRGMEKGLEKGREEGLRQSLASFVKLKHEDHAAELLALLDAVTDESRLAPLCDAVFAADGLDGVRAALAAASGPKP